MRKRPARRPPAVTVPPVLLIAALLFLPASPCAAQENAPYEIISSDMPLPKLYNDDGDGFIVIAHRGASADHPENTMPAFEAAVERGAEMIELDVMMSRDGVPVVFHDARLSRHTDGAGPVVDHTLEQLRELDAGSWFGKKFSGTKIPTLEEVVQWASGRIALNIEIKTEAVGDRPEEGVEQKAVDLVREYGMEEYVIFSSFDYRAVRRFKQISPNLSVALLYNRGLSGEKSPSHLVSEYGADAFNLNYTQLSDKRLENLKAFGIPFLVYTVDTRRRMRSLINKGAAGIFSNKPGLLREVAEAVR